jgi:flagellar protein FliJ
MMKKFSFRLETVLKLRRLAEDEKQRAVGQLLSEIHDCQQQAVKLDLAARAAGSELKERNQTGRIDLTWMGNYQSYVGHLRAGIAERIDMVAQLQQRLTEARQELAEAAKQTKILEKLKEKRKQRYDSEIKRAETREQDDIASRNFLRSRVSA